ncbi:U32 family peptidase [Tepidibacter thalassicus]|uniref:Putative protease n=1 Tax=Tepidibacter thalassicus DSM 15285 TaxID=1123350 RepID=A0A1M5RE16_9FIRM|nr:U32 family peptidase [Tepidibacter thalassicus]SHH24380.1 putative protease [Tepidibacter thalassicus DSM 15285]
MNNIEILAPVGNFDSLKAAVLNGADAVYLGGKNFSARASANNFDKEELKEAVKYAHIRDVKVYVTVNTLIKESEINSFLKYINFLYNIDVDALILQDVGMASLVKKHFPYFEIHASTQMVAHSLEDVKYLENLGFKRVVLARELTVEEIEYISKNSNVDIEVFVHGALCVCYSGQCLMSSMIGGRSGNRGRCAQPCRKVYELIDIEKNSKVHLNDKYLLSPRDLNTIEELDRIIKSGVLSLKIEGRMKRAEYVATVVGAYREVVDYYLENKKLNVKKETLDDLYSIFNRKFTKGYILGEIGKDIMNPQKPNNTGLYIGKVIDIDKRKNKITLKLENTLRKGDGLSIGGGNVGRILKGNKILDVAYRNDIVQIDFKEEIKVGQDVYKTLDTNLLDRARKTYENNIENKKIPIRSKIILNLDEYPVLLVKDYRNNKIKVVADKKVEKAIKVSISDEKIKNQIEKLGNTPYVLENIVIEKDENISIPVSVLNEIRREAIEKLDNKRKNINKRKLIKLDIENKGVIYEKNKNLKISVRVRKLYQLKKILDLDIDIIYYEDINTLEEAMALCDKLVYSPPRILRNKQYYVLDKALDMGVDKFQVSNLGMINKLSQSEIYGDYFLNIFNSRTIEKFKNQGLRSICISPELNLKEIKEVLKHTDIEAEALVYGRIPLMISEYCPMGVLIRNCKKDKRCGICNKSKYGLKDEKGELFPIAQDMFCRSVIYNSKVLCMIDHLKDIYDAGINIFRLDFTFEKEEYIREILKAYIDIIKNNFEFDEEIKIYEKLKREGITKGHYLRGVE